jgi:hypothetical protein
MKKITHLLFFFFLLSSTQYALSAATPAGSILENQIVVSYQDALGKTHTAKSNIISITIRKVYAVTLTEVSGMQQQVAAIPNMEVDSVHRLQNTGNVRSTYQLMVENVQSTPVAPKGIAALQLGGGSVGDTIDAEKLLIFHDKNNNGIVDAAEVTPISEISLDPNEKVSLIVRSMLPKLVKKDDRLDITFQAKDKESETVVSSQNWIKLTLTDSNTSDLTLWSEAEGGNCHAYKVIGSSRSLSWTDAKAKADRSLYRGIRGHLVSISDQPEQDFLCKITSRNSVSYWIGLSRSETPNSQYEWNTDEEFSYANWGLNEPSLGVQNYIMMWHGGKGRWYDKPNDGGGTISHYIIEFDMQCKQPKINLQLFGAKDLNCDQKAESDFGTLRLSDMESGECAIMDIIGVNDSGVIAKKIKLHHQLQDFMSYQQGSLKMCRGDRCTLVPQGEINEDENRILFNVGEMGLNAQVHARFGVKID